MKTKEKKVKVLKNQQYKKAEYSVIKVGFHLARRSRPDITYKVITVSNGPEAEHRYVTLLQRTPSHQTFDLTEEQLYKRDYILITDPAQA